MLRLRRYERISVRNRRFRSNGGRLTQILGRRGRTLHRQTDGRTDRQTEFSSPDRVRIPCSAVKKNLKITRSRTFLFYLLTHPVIDHFFRVGAIGWDKALVTKFYGITLNQMANVMFVIKRNLFFMIIKIYTALIDIETYNQSVKSKCMRRYRQVHVHLHLYQT